MESGKKISFGFNKSNKKPAVIFNKPVEHNKVELVDCLEGQSIKIKDAVEVVNEPLVIPFKDNKKNLLDRLKEAKSKQKQLIKDDSKQEEDTRPDSELTIEELAARELIRDAKNHLSNKTPDKILVLPIKEDKLILDGESEPTLDDYENVPVTDFGMAMLRGMGWKEGIGIGKNLTKSASTKEPELRPKGLGLGANRMVKAEISNEIARDNDGNELILKRGTFAKIIAGSHKGNYCEVLGLDDEAGRVIAKTSLKGEILTLNEFLIVPVTKEEYSKGSRILNNAKYEEYKEISDKKLENYRKKKSDSTDKYKEEVDKGGSSSRHFNENQSTQDDEEKSTRSNDKDLTSKEVSRRYSSKNNTHGNKNGEYEKIDKYSKDTNKDKYENRNRHSRRDKNKYSSESDSDSERKNRKDNDRKKHYRGESSRSHEEKYKSDKKSSKSRHRSRSSSSDYDERETHRKNKKSGHHKHDSRDREKTSKKTRK